MYADNTFFVSIVLRIQTTAFTKDQILLLALHVVFLNKFLIRIASIYLSKNCLPSEKSSQ